MNSKQKIQPQENVQMENWTGKRTIHSQKSANISIRSDLPPIKKQKHHVKTKFYENLNQVESEYGDYVSTMTIGSSYEGRDIRVVRLNPGNAEKKIWIDAGKDVSSFKESNNFPFERISDTFYRSKKAAKIKIRQLR